MSKYHLAHSMIATDTIPAEPGTTPVPAGHVRLYHYFPYDKVDDIKTNGINIDQARGETYGEPNTVWASGKMPSKTHTFVEFSVSKDDDQWLINKPKTDEDARIIQDRGWDVTFNRTIGPEKFIAVHEPWHGHYRYIMNDPELFEEVKQGKLDHLLDDKDYAPAIRRIKAEG